jgi:hypothetical protein
VLGSIRRLVAAAVCLGYLHRVQVQGGDSNATRSDYGVMKRNGAQQMVCLSCREEIEISGSRLNDNFVSLYTT